MEGIRDIGIRQSGKIHGSLHKQMQIISHKLKLYQTCPVAGSDDEFHSDKHIPLWIEITAGVFTFGLFTMISELIGSEIQSYRRAF